MLNIKNRDNLLGVAAAIAFLIGSANALEYFIAGKNYLSINKGVVEKLIYEKNKRPAENGGCGSRALP